MSNWFKKITGVAKIERQREEAEARLAEAEAAVAKQKEEERLERVREEERQKQINKEKEEREAELERIREKEELAKLSPKERATKKGEAWVDVLQTHVNEENIRNGFFELDWNQKFVDDLITAGYGTESDPEEEIVDRWFRDIVSQMLSDEGLDPQSRAAGYINVESLGNSRSEVS